MADTASILRRKAGGGAPPGALTPEKAMTLAFGRAGRARPGLNLRMTGFSMSTATLGTLIAAAPEGALCVTLDREGAVGGAALAEGPFVGALIEAETMRRRTHTQLEPRTPTRIDALIAGEFVDSALAAYDDIATDLSIAAASRGWRWGQLLPSPQVLQLILDDVPLRLFSMSFDFAAGAREGQLLLAMPQDPPKPPEVRAQGFGTALHDAVLAAPAEVRAVLGRLPQPLTQVSAWAPGTLLPIPRDALMAIELHDIEGEVVARGRLGQVSGMRAVRILPPDTG